MERTVVVRDLWSQDPAEVSAVAENIGAELVIRLRTVVPRARRGNPAAILSYVRAWRMLESRVLWAFHQSAPNIVVESEGRILLADTEGRPSPHLTALLDQEALHAPYSVWVQAVGEGTGIAVHLIAAIRRFTGQTLLPVPEHLAEPLLFAQASPSFDPAGFLRLAARELEVERSSLDRIADLFKLNDTGLAKLFGVSRQRIAQWRDEGVALAHHSKLNTISRIADVFEHNLIRDRIPGIVRTVAPSYGARTLLQAIADDGHEDARRLVEDSFDWAKTA